MASPQARKYQGTINNPLDAGFTHNVIAERLQRFSPEYYCMADEVASTGTFHTHFFVFANSPIRFSTMKNRFPTAHIEKAFGTVRENRDYIRKEGKFFDTAKAETSVEGSFEEWGELPEERQEKHPEMYQLLQDVEEGKSTAKIVVDSPNFAFRVKDIDILRQSMLEEKYMSEPRDIQVNYLHGPDVSKLTEFIYKHHEAKEIYRLTNYRQGKGLSFDGYHSQDILVFTSFESQVSIGEMLLYLGRYPLHLPARYSDKVACFTQIYITSHIPLSEQYIDVQRNSPTQWDSLLNRINQVITFHNDGTHAVTPL